jgi:hypothetical protein
MATVLSPGDIAIIGYASDDPDSFAFVFLRNVEAGTTINFTDQGWQAAGGFRPGEGSATFTAPTDMAAGTVVSVPVGSMAFDFFGDQIIAYQGTEANPTFLYAIDFADGDSAFAGDATSTVTSAIPAGLTLGVTAVAIPFDNAAYTGPTSGSQLDLLEAIGDPTNWTGSDTGPQPRSPPILFAAGRPAIDLDYDNSTHGGRDYKTTYAQGGTSVRIGDTDINIFDSDGETLESATIKIGKPKPDNLLFVNGTLPAGITASAYDSASGILTLSGTASLAAYEAAIGLVEFSSTSEPIGEQKRIEVTVFDGTDASPEAKAFINIVAATASPVLDLDANNSDGGGADYTATFNEGGPATPIADIDVLITDPDSPTLASAMITLGINRQPDDVLSINGTLPGGITASGYDPNTGVLTLTGAATPAAYQTALRQVVYSNTSATPFTGDRVIEVTVNDGTVTSNIARTFMHVVGVENIPPALNLDADSSTTGGADYLASFTEGGPPIAITDTDVSIVDSDSPTLVSATITLTNPQANDVLNFSGFPPSGITASSYDPVTGVLELAGIASLADYQTALRQITFENTGTNPTSDTRIIEVVVNDGTAPSNTANAIIEVVEVNNNAPTLDLDQDDSTAPGTTYRATFTENGAAVTIADIDTTITDIDSATLASARITLTNAQTGDLLAISGTLPAGITPSIYDPVTGTLTLSGTASLADYQAALAQIRFSTAGDDPVTDGRVVEVVVNDGVNDSNAATALITVTAENDPPTIAVEEGVIYVENGAALPLSPLVAVTDPDNTELAFAAVLITNGSFPGDGDVLTINGATSGTIDGVAFQWDPTLHSLTLFGAKPVATYQELLRDIEFRSTSDNPTDFNANPTRTLTWVVSDGPRATTAMTTLNITARNDRPDVVVPATAAYAENDPPLTVSPAAVATDADSLNLTAGQVTIVSGGFAGDLLTVNGLQSGTFAGIQFSYDAGLQSLLFSLAAPVADYQAFLQAVQFQSTSENPTNSGVNPKRTLSWTVFDGRDVSTFQTTTLDVTGVNDAPVNTVSGAQRVNEDAPLPIADVSVADVDGDMLVTTLSVTHGALNVTAGPGVSGNGTSTVIITGTMAAINAALAGLSYLGNLDFNGPDTLTVTTDDGTSTDTDTIGLSVDAVNDPVTASAPATATVRMGSSIALTGLSIGDIDTALAPSGVYAVTLSAGQGILTLATTTGLTFDSGGPSAASMTFHGTLAAINAALATASYAPLAGNNGSDVIGFAVTDSINGVVATGAGPATGDSKSISVTVTPLVGNPGDFNADQFDDYLLRRNDGTFQIQEIVSGQVTPVILGPVGLEWRSKGVGDFNNDGISDYLLQRDSDHMLQIQQISSNQVAAVTFLGPVGSEWQVLGIGDFNGDHTDDVLWQREDGTLRVYDINNYQISATPLAGRIGREWHFAAVGDFNADGTSDALWRHDDGTVLIQDFNNNQVTGAQTIGKVGNEWQVIGTGDFNGDHTGDILFQRDDGTLRIYDINNYQVSNTLVLETLAADTRVAGISDFDGDATSDILLRHDDGTFQFQSIRDNVVTQTVTLGPVGNEWHIV